jgi:hypothetical protein
MARNAAPPILTAKPGFTHYLEEIRRFPMLERQEEYLLAKRWREHSETTNRQGDGRNHVECLDHIVVLGEANLRRILWSYAGYYNDVRTHRSLDKDASVSRAVQQTGIISSHPILGGLHRHYVRA